MLKISIQEIRARNDLRREAGLPLLSISAELRKKVRAVQLERRDSEWRSSPLRKMVEAEVLEEQRIARGDPGWVPSGILSGGRLAFALEVRRRVIGRMG